MNSLSSIPESRQRDLFPDAPVEGKRFLCAKLIDSIEEMAILCADMCRLHDLTIGVHGTWRDWDEKNVAIPDRLWFRQVILDHIKRSLERKSTEQWCSSSGRITMIEERNGSPHVSGFRIAFDIGHFSATAAKRLLEAY